MNEGVFLYGSSNGIFAASIILPALRDGCADLKKFLKSLNNVKQILRLTGSS